MKMYKRILKSTWFIHMLARLTWAYIRFVHLTSTWTVHNSPIIKAYMDHNKPVIVVFWHNRLFLNALGWTYPVPFHMLISQHSDGKLIARVMHHFNIQTIEGSTNRSGAEALRTMLKKLKNNDCIGITPDGPRGPRFQITDGVVALARLSGCDVIPGVTSIKRRKVLQSWDRFILALPFSKAVFVWGKPLSIKKDASPKEVNDFKIHLEKHLTETCNQADHLCGHGPLRS